MRVPPAMYLVRNGGIESLSTATWPMDQSSVTVQ